MRNAKRSVFMIEILNAEREAFRVHAKWLWMRNAKRSVFMIKIINAEREAFRVHAKIINAEREAFRVYAKDFKCGTRSVPCSYDIDL